MRNRRGEAMIIHVFNPSDTTAACDLFVDFEGVIGTGLGRHMTQPIR
jgi:hypothetical protein